LAFAVAFNQVLIIFLLMAIGFLAGKLRYINEASAKDMTLILCYIVSPCVILKAFLQPFSKHELHNLFIAFLCVIGIHIFSILAGKIAFNRRTVNEALHRRVLQFASVYSNCGFMGIPLVSTVLGTTGIFYGTVYLAAFNVFCWTHGLALYQDDNSKKSLLNIIINPNIIALIIGLIFYVSSVNLPYLLSTGLTYIYDLNTPLSMLVIGSNISRIKFSTLLNDVWIWPGILMRNLAIPAAILLAFHWITVDKTALMAILLMTACPVAGNSVLFAQMNDHDTAFATKLMAVSTLLSIATIPLIVYLASL
jgi:predicted permease